MACRIAGIALLATLIGRGVTRPIRSLTEAMERLAAGHLDHEIRRMIGAVQLFKDNLIRTRQLEADTAQAQPRGNQLRARSGSTASMLRQAISIDLKGSWTLPASF